MPKVSKPEKKAPVAENLHTALHIGASSVSMMVAERCEKGLSLIHI